MSNPHILDDFDELYSAIEKVFDEVITELRKKSRSVTFVSGIHFLLVALLIAGFGISRTSTLLPFISIFVWVFVMIKPATSMARWLPRGKAAIFLGFSFVLNPALLGISIHLLAPWLSLPTDPNPALLYSVLAIVLSVVSFVFLYIYMLMNSNNISSTLLLVLSSTSLQDFLSAIPCHTEIAKRATSAGIELVEDWDEIRVHQVAEVVKIRLDGSNAQGQSLSFILATIGLISTIGLVLTQEQIRSAFAALEGFLSQAIYGQPIASGASGGVAMVVAIILSCFIVVGLFFFSTSYQTLRTLEVMQIVCSLQITKHTASHRQSSPRQRTNSSTQSPTSNDQLPKMIGGLIILMYFWRFLFPRRKY
jgi:hypothetical protein